MLLYVKVKPNQRIDRVEWVSGEWVVRLAAPAIDGKANAELTNFLAEFFEVKNRSVKIVRGEKGKEKTVEISGRTEEELEDVMETIP